MALLSALLNLASCGATGVLGTGTHGCKPFFKKTYSLWLTPAGFEYDGTQVWDTTYINTLINSGQLIVLKGISQPENQSTDNTLTDIGGGVEILEDEGLYKFKYDFVKGVYFNSALATLVSYGVYDVAFVDTAGSIFGTEAPTAGKFKGFTTAQISHNPMAFGDVQTGRESIVIQYPERAEVDADYVFIERELGVFNPKSIDGINEVSLSYSIAPANTDTIINVKAVRKQDNNAFTGAVFGDFGCLVDGVDNPVTAGDDSAVTGTYILTITALSSAENVATQLGTLAVPGITVGSRNYKSNLITALVP